MPAGLQPATLPLDHLAFWCRGEDSNLQAVGFEPTRSAVASPRHTAIHAKYGIHFSTPSVTACCRRTSFRVGTHGLVFGVMRASCGVLLPFLALHGLQAATTFFHTLLPPRLTGTMWSTVA